MEIIKRNPSSLKNYDKNARTHSAAQIEEIINSIQKFGFNDPIEIDSNDVIISGHARVEASIKLGLTEVPTICHGHLNKADKKAYVLATNRIALNAGWDAALLKEEFLELKEDNFNLSLTGFTQEEIDAYLNPEVLNIGVADENACEGVGSVAISKRGDVWVLGEHRLMCGDSTSVNDMDVLMDGKSADMIFTDPPYGLDYQGGRGENVKNKEYGKIINDNLEGSELGELIANIFSYQAKQIYICVSPIIQKPFLDFIHSSGKEVEAVIVWDKGTMGLGYMAYRRQCEFIYYIREIPFKKTDNSDCDLWSIPRDAGVEYVHATQKPVGVPERAIKNSTKPNEIVLDLFGGSGTTLIACEKLGRKCVMMELDEKYCDVIIRRWEKFTGKKAVLESNGEGFNDC